MLRLDEGPDEQSNGWDCDDHFDAVRSDPIGIHALVRVRTEMAQRIKRKKLHTLI